MKKFFKSIQAACLIIMAVSIALATLIPAMYYVAASAMLVMAIAAIAEPSEKAACPRVFSKVYRAQYHAA
jgi:uncharacterized protein (DUF58 family)